MHAIYELLDLRGWTLSLKMAIHKDLLAQVVLDATDDRRRLLLNVLRARHDKHLDIGKSSNT